MIFIRYIGTTIFSNRNIDKTSLKLETHVDITRATNLLTTIKIVYRLKEVGCIRLLRAGNFWVKLRVFKKQDKPSLEWQTETEIGSE